MKASNLYNVKLSVS